jgi:hypothetical protein
MRKLLIAWSLVAIGGCADEAPVDDHTVDPAWIVAKRSHSGNDDRPQETMQRVRRAANRSTDAVVLDPGPIAYRMETVDDGYGPEERKFAYLTGTVVSVVKPGALSAGQVTIRFRPVSASVDFDRRFFALLSPGDGFFVVEYAANVDAGADGEMVDMGVIAPKVAELGGLL